MADKISRLMDGELDDAEFEIVCGHLRRPDAVATWVCYHVIGDALRGGPMPRPGFADRTAGRGAAGGRSGGGAGRVDRAAPFRGRGFGRRERRRVGRVCGDRCRLVRRAAPVSGACLEHAGVDAGGRGRVDARRRTQRGDGCGRLAAAALRTSAGAAPLTLAGRRPQRPRRRMACAALRAACAAPEAGRRCRS